MKDYNELSAIQQYYMNKATEKARVKGVTVNGWPATVVFSEYEAPENLIADFQSQDGTDGHFYYIEMFIWQGLKSYCTGKEISSGHRYMTDKEEGNKIYRQLLKTKSLSF